MIEPTDVDPQLIWHNKNMPLTSHPGGSYVWSGTDDSQSETHSLREIGTFGSDPSDNLLISGDARQALDALIGSPRFAATYVGQVMLAYVDPPFNTGNKFVNYHDRYEHSRWLTLFRDGLIRSRTLLSESGSIWVHLDDNEQHRARVVMDEVFGAANFVSTVIWERTRTPRAAPNALSTRHDYIHIYRKSPSFALRPPVQRRDERSRRTHSLWSTDDVGSGREGSAESRRLFTQPFATPKPERLLARVLALGTDPGDIVLDYFAGSGTTAAVAHKLKRRWIAVESNEDTVSDFLQQRLVGVVAGNDSGGITKEAQWAGGGGFTRLNVEPSTLG